MSTNTPSADDVRAILSQFVTHPSASGPARFNHAAFLDEMQARKSTTGGYSGQLTEREKRALARLVAAYMREVNQ
jgi:hypothetical protein